MTEAVDEYDLHKNDYVFGYWCLFSSMVCLGTWPAFLRLASTVTEEKEQSGILSTKDNGQKTKRRNQRDVRFVYLDYAFSYVISSWFPLLVEKVIFRSNDSNINTENDSDININDNFFMERLLWIGFASMGGVLLSIGNLTLQWATTVYKAPLTTIVAIQASLTVLVGTSLNALLEHLSKTPRPLWLFVGVLLFLVAIGTATSAHQAYASLSCTTVKVGSSNHEMSGSTDESFSDDYESTECNDCISRSIELQGSTRSYGSSGDGSTNSYSSIRDDILHDNDFYDDESGTFGPQRELEVSIHSEIAIDAHVNGGTRSSQKALLLAIIGGCSFGFFSPAFNVAVNDPFGFAKSNSETSDGGLSVVTANLWFSFAFTISSVVGTMLLLRSPPPSSGLTPGLTVFEDYPKSVSIRSPSCRWGIAAGFVCGVANLLQFRGGRLVGFATADLVHSYPLVSTFWDVVLFGEYRSSRNLSAIDSFETSGRIIRTTYFYLVAMYVLYVGGIVCVVMSAMDPLR